MSKALFEMEANASIGAAPFGTGCALSGIISGSSPKPGMAQNEFRKYISTLTSGCDLRGSADVTMKKIVYQIGERRADATELPVIPGHVDRIATSFKVSAFMATEFVGAAKKYANFTSDFAFADLSGVVERLAAGLALFVQKGTLTCAMLRGGGTNDVVALGAVNQGVIASRNCVFVPRFADSPISPNMFAALINAVNGEGSVVVTDILELNSNNNRLIVPNPSDLDLVSGIHKALCVLGANFEQANVGDLFAYAVTRGIHSIVSVVGHSDEGAIMRNVLRQNAFSPPYGGILLGLTAYQGLPKPASENVSGWCMLVDSIALATAGAVAYCDPCVELNGRIYPTVLTSGRGKMFRAGTSTEGDAGDAMDIAGKLVDVAGRFVELYIKALGQVFCISGSHPAAKIHMLGCFSKIAMDGDDRHLRYKSVAPFFWVEPSGVCHLNKKDYVAADAGYASICNVDSPALYPMFEGAEEVGNSDGRGGIIVKWRSARTSAIITHLFYHHKDGLANIIPRQADPSMFVHTGRMGGQSITEAMESETDIAEFLWQHGDCPIPLPSESLYLEEAIGLAIKTSADGEGLRQDKLHVPLVSELVKGNVFFTVTRPRAVAVGVLTHSTREVKRARTTAANALSSARVGGGTTLIDTKMMVSFTAPRFKIGAAEATRRDIIASPIGEQRSAASTDVAPPTPEKVYSEVVLSSQSLAEKSGPQVGVIMHQEPVRGAVRGITATQAGPVEHAIVPTVPENV